MDKADNYYSLSEAQRAQVIAFAKGNSDRFRELNEVTIRELSACLAGESDQDLLERVVRELKDPNSPSSRELEGARRSIQGF